MILNGAPQDQAIMSNVGEVGDFKIKASAKAFSILSSGLYANKIKAIIRELSCNALDSHTAAGNTQPFDVHIPSSLEPYFYVRDYGTGLNHEQVSQIYTTYFESTKTDSNAYIGALGLGSKSPFSYTDNFTVTAIKEGVKRIYTAFINGEGVPAIALMGEEESTEPAGVEVKFSVNDRYDFGKFYDEARNVFRYFKQRPNILGATDFDFSDIEYETENIIPGVHATKGSVTRAVMGNIAYPVEIPSSDKVLGGLHNLLKCGLEMHFEIGELDFQASREGLSYIPSTIEAIRNKLIALNAQLATHISDEADAIVNKWERSIFLYKKRHSPLWHEAVNEYATKTSFELYDIDNRWRSSSSIKVPQDTLQACNIVVRSFNSLRHVKAMSQVSIDVDHKSNGQREYYWTIPVTTNINFVLNDAKVGATERAKHHFRTKENRPHDERVYVLEPIDRNKPMMVEAFKNLIHNPPSSMFLFASTLRQKDRVSHNGMGKNVTIMKLEERGGSRYHSSSHDLVWRDGGKLDDFDKTTNHYYVPLAGFLTKFDKLPNHMNAHSLAKLLANTMLPEFNVTVHGVRKGDIDAIKKQKNWVNLEDFVYETVKKLDEKFIIAGAVSLLDRHQVFEYNCQALVDGITNDKSPAKLILSQFVGLPKAAGYHAMKQLMQYLNIEPKLDTPTLVQKFNKELGEISARYPLIRRLDSRSNENDVFGYINLVDEVKGV